VKTITRGVLPFQEKEIFIVLRDKIDYVKLLAYSARILLLNYDTTGIKTNGSLKLIIDKMSRVFFYREDKCFSVSFPFNVLIDEENVLEITTYSGKKVDSQNISSILSIINDEQFRLNPSPIDFWIETSSVDSLGFALLEEMLQFEPAYIRYDVDPKNENGKLHPLHHLDVNYSSYGTYKLGLSDQIEGDYFENILDINTECSFVID
jgi:hypothetical protein